MKSNIIGLRFFSASFDIVSFLKFQWWKEVSRVLTGIQFMVIACQDHCSTQFFCPTVLCQSCNENEITTCWFWSEASFEYILHSLNDIKIGFVFKCNKHLQFGADCIGNCWTVWCLKPWTEHLSAQPDYPNYFHLSIVWHHNGNSEQRRQPRVIARGALKPSAPRAGGNWSQLQLRLQRKVILGPAVVESPGAFYPLKWLI